MKVLRLTAFFDNGEIDHPATGYRVAVGGMGRQIGALSAELDRRGVQQHVLTARPALTPTRARLGSHGAVIRLGRPAPAFRRTYAATAGRWLRDVNGLDLVHAHQGHDLRLLPLAAQAARRMGVPLVVTLHSSLRHGGAAEGLSSMLQKAIGSPLEGRVLLGASAVIVLNRSTRDRLLRSGLSDERVHLIPAGVNNARFGGGAEAQLAALPRPRVLYAGRLDPRHDVLTLACAASSLRTAGVALVIAGEGPDAPMLRHVLRQQGLQDVVTLLGAVPHGRMPGLLAESDVLAVPNRSPESGTIVLEAMRMGLPVVAASGGAASDLVVHGRTGILVPPGDASALAGALDRVLADPGLRARMGVEALRRAPAYDMTECAERVLNVYEAAVSARAAGNRRHLALVAG